MCRSIGTSGRRTSATASTTMSVSCVCHASVRSVSSLRSSPELARARAAHLVRQLRVQLGAQRGACHLQHDVALGHTVGHLHWHFELRRELQRRLLGNVEALATRRGCGRGSAAGSSAAALRARPAAAVQRSGAAAGGARASQMTRGWRPSARWRCAWRISSPAARQRARQRCRLCPPARPRQAASRVRGGRRQREARTDEQHRAGGAVAAGQGAQAQAGARQA